MVLARDEGGEQELPKDATSTVSRALVASLSAAQRGTITLTQDPRGSRWLLPCPPLLPTRISPPAPKDEIRNANMASQQYVLSPCAPSPQVLTDPRLSLSPVYPSGDVCISILHPPEEDKYGYESAAERWSPVQTPETILLSVISMLSSPNDESPANVEAARMWREDAKEFKRKCRRCVRDSLEGEA